MFLLWVPYIKIHFYKHLSRLSHAVKYWKIKYYRKTSLLKRFNLIPESFSCRHEKLFFRYNEQLLSDITWLCTSEIDAAQLRLRSVTEIAPKSPSFSCVSRIPIQYCFPIRAGVKTAWKLKFDSILFWMRVWAWPFYRYGGHIEFIRFKEYYGMPSGHEHDPI